MFGQDSKLGPKKTKSVIHPVKCTLEDLYNGKSFKVRINRDRVIKEGDKNIVNKEKKVIAVGVDKGAPDGEKYTFHGEADEHPVKEAGDVIFVVAQEKHEYFKRKGADLLMTKEITLLDSIVGADFEIKHLDGTTFRVQSAPGQVI